jgi:DNA-binding transcriptional ArsR family regulator
MPRAATTTDAFNAIAEPRRRQILDLLLSGELPVNDLVSRLGLAQPQVSKHLRVLREVGLVEVREEGRRRMYRINGGPLKPIASWLERYEQLWAERFDRMDAVLAGLQAGAEHQPRTAATPTHPAEPKEHGDDDDRQ